VLKGIEVIEVQGYPREYLIQNPRWDVGQQVK